jgi:hypothetical protein
VDGSLAEWRTEEHSARREVEDAGGGSGLAGGGGKERCVLGGGREWVLGSPAERRKGAVQERRCLARLLPCRGLHFSSRAPCRGLELLQRGRHNGVG